MITSLVFLAMIQARDQIEGIEMKWMNKFCNSSITLSSPVLCVTAEECNKCVKSANKGTT